MRRLMGAVIPVLALGMVACSSSSPKAQTVSVDVDGNTSDFAGVFTAYFPSTIQAHGGDTIEFHSIFRGEPHTVTMGRLVDTALPKVDPNAQDEPPELKKIPDLLPEGPGDANQPVGQPCFLASGDLPANGAPCSSAQQKQPEFNGKQTFYNSGFLPDGAVYRVKLAKDIKAGTYNFFCTLHRASMSGKIVVAKGSTKIPTPQEVRTAGQNELNDLVGKLRPAATALKTGTVPGLVPTAQPGSVIAGSGTMDIQNALVTEFGPPTISVPVGGAVTWTILGAHTISFNAPESARTIITKAPDGSVHASQQVGAPSGGPGQPQEPPPSGPPPQGPPPPPKVVDAGSWDGTGFHSSGLFLSFPPQLYAYKLTFTKAGTYSYACLVHPDMKGTVRVG